MGKELIDGQYFFDDIQEHFNKAKDFKTEDDLCAYLDLNMESLCKELKIDYKSHKREAYMTKLKRFGANIPRIDFLITDQEGNKILLEVKKPNNRPREVIMSIAQLLDYYLLAEDYGHKIKKAYILTTQINNSFTAIVERFNLPIDLILFSKGKIAIWDKEADKNVKGIE